MTNRADESELLPDPNDDDGDVTPRDVFISTR